MANEFLAQALEECASRRYKNEAEEQRRMAHAIEICPRIATLDRERRQDILDGLKLAMEGIRPEGIEERTEKRNREILELLRTNNLPEDFLDPVYQCSLCQDSGYTGHAPKKICSCVMSRYRQLVSGETDTDDSPSFERFDISLFPDHPLDKAGTTQKMLMQVLRRHCEDYADNLPSSKQNLILHGPSGLGKTYLLRCVAKRARDKGIDTLTFNANALLNQIRQAYFARDAEPEQPYYDIPLLLIDDLGTEPLWENITLEQIFALLEYRIQNKLHTVISTNMDPDSLQKRYTRRIYSRLMDRYNSLVLRFQGEDIRLIPR